MHEINQYNFKLLLNVLRLSDFVNNALFLLNNENHFRTILGFIKIVSKIVNTLAIASLFYFRIN